ncbi:hypothetical protein FJZ40_03770 [Candidatus Shapirobacteria bacterium]|nr:hypothetical protein [Candidatus Shapirobacteria bacterium]
MFFLNPAKTEGLRKAVNLLPEKGKLGEKWRGLAEKTRAAGMVTLILVVVLLGLVNAGELYLQAQEKSISNGLALATSRIQKQKNTEIILTLLKKRSSLIGSVLESRYDPLGVLKPILGLLPPDFAIDKFNLNEKEFLVSLKGKDVLVVDQFLDEFPNQIANSLKSTQKKLSFSEIRRSASGNYDLTFEVDF